MILVNPWRAVTFSYLAILESNSAVLGKHVEHRPILVELGTSDSTPPFSRADSAICLDCFVMTVLNPDPAGSVQQFKWFQIFATINTIDISFGRIWKVVHIHVPYDASDIGDIYLFIGDCYMWC